MRLAYARLNQETHCLSPVSTTISDFAHYLEGEDLAHACSRKGSEVQGLLKHAELSGFVRACGGEGVEAVPLLSAWAFPGGPLTRETVETLRDRLVSALRSVEVDGLFLSLHGAMGARDLEGPEALVCEALRDVLGERPLVASFDLHGLLTPRMMAAIDAPVAYRTNPHRDHAATGRRAGELLIRMAREDFRPAVAWRSLPLVMGGGTTIDLLQPMRGVFGQMSRAEKRKGVLSTSLFMCHLWNDSPELGWSVAAVAEDTETAEDLADELADAAWAVRHEQPPEFLSTDEALAKVRNASLRRALGCVTICDASDVTGAGAPGENTHLIRALHAGGEGLLSLAAIRDELAVQRLAEATIDEEVDLELGGRRDSSSPPLPLRGRLVFRDSHEGFGHRAVLDCGHLKLVVTEAAPISMDPSFYESAGLSVWKADIVVVKSFFHFRWHYRLQNRLALYVKTAGLTDFDAMREFDFASGVWPFEAVENWRPTDRRRRLKP